MSIKKEKPKITGRPTKETKSLYDNARDYVRREWSSNPNTSRNQLREEIAEKYGVRVGNDIITRWTDGIDKPHREKRKERKVIPLKQPTREEINDYQKRISRRVFEIEWGNEGLTENNFNDMVVKTNELPTNRKRNVSRQIGKEAIAIKEAIEETPDGELKDSLQKRLDLLNRFLKETAYSEKNLPVRGTPKTRGQGTGTLEDVTGLTEKGYAKVMGNIKRDYFRKRKKK